jgi:hypothetical protein
MWAVAPKEKKMFVEPIHCVHEKVTADTNDPVLPLSDIHPARLNSLLNVTLILTLTSRTCDYEGFYTSRVVLCLSDNILEKHISSMFCVETKKAPDYIIS